MLKSESFIILRFKYIPPHKFRPYALSVRRRNVLGGCQNISKDFLGPSHRGALSVTQDKSTQPCRQHKPVLSRDSFQPFPESHNAPRKNVTLRDSYGCQIQYHKCKCL